MKVYIEGKPVKLSPWARWVVMEHNGKCIEFAREPQMLNGYWYGMLPKFIGVVRDPRKYDWCKTLTEVPR